MAENTVRYDFGLGHIADALDSTYSYLQKQAAKKAQSKSIQGVLGGIHSMDPVVNDYLMAASKHVGIDNAAANALILKAMERAGEVMDKDMNFMMNNPEVYSEIADETGGIDYDSKVKFINKKKDERKRLLEYLSKLETGDILEKPKESLITAATEESLFKNSADPLVKTIRDMVIEGEKNYTRIYNTSTDANKSALNSVNSSINIDHRDLNRLRGDLKGLNESLSMAINGTEKTTINKNIENLKTEMENKNLALFQKHMEKDEILGNMGAKPTKRQKETKELLEAINANKDKYGLNETVRRINESLKRQGTSLEAYDIYLISE